MGCALAGCSLLTPLDGLEAIDAAAGGDAAADTKIDVEAGVCGSLHGPSMIVVPSLNPSGSYCIDSTEVTQAQYKAFLDANVAPSTQPSFCASNTSFYPDLVQNECASHPFDPTGAPTMPAACVDWCDAYAFCAWAGKRLCGEIGHDAGPLDPQLINAAVHSQWFNACSQEGKLVYPYGNAYDASACNGADQPVRVVVPVATMPGCVGGYPGIFDMSGNVSEWESSCTDAAADAAECNVRGGSTSELSAQLACGQVNFAGRAVAAFNLGIRCCADL